MKSDHQSPLQSIDLDSDREQRRILEVKVGVLVRERDELRAEVEQAVIALRDYVPKMMSLHDDPVLRSFGDLLLARAVRMENLHA